MVSKRNFRQCITQVLNQSNAAFDGTASDEDSLLHLQSARDIFFAGSQYKLFLRRSDHDPWRSS